MRLHGSCEELRSPFDLRSLAATLAAADPRFLVWKGGRELQTQGDLDCAAPRASWAVLAQAFGAWSRARGLTAMVTCAHAPGTLVLVGCGGTAESKLLQVDLVEELLVHGAPAWNAADAAAARASLDGIPHTLPGAEGVLRRLAHRSDAAGLELVTSDPPAAERITRRLGVRGRLAARPDAVGTRLLLEAVLAARSFLHPISVVRALSSDRARWGCCVLRALRRDRTIEGDVDEWLDEAARNHDVRRLATVP